MPFQGAKEKYILPRGDTLGYKIEGFQPSCIHLVSICQSISCNRPFLLNLYHGSPPFSLTVYHIPRQRESFSWRKRLFTQNSIEYTTDLWYNNSRYTVFGGMPPPENPPQAEKHYGGIPSWIRLWNKSWQNARAARNTPLFSAL